MAIHRSNLWPSSAMLEAPIFILVQSANLNIRVADYFLAQSMKIVLLVFHFYIFIWYFTISEGVLI